MLEATVTIPDETVSRVSLNDASTELLRKLWIQYGPLMFHQSGGCCDGSSPMCYPAGDFITGDSDIKLAELVLDDATVPVGRSRPQFEYWKHTHLTIDVVPGRGAGFSLEAPYGVRFLIRSRLLTSEELQQL